MNYYYDEQNRIEILKKLNDSIKEEKSKEKPNKHKIYRLMEQKLIQGMFSLDSKSSYERFRSPW